MAIEIRDDDEQAMRKYPIETKREDKREEGKENGVISILPRRHQGIGAIEL